MKSIRLYLVLAVVATITLVNFLSTIHGYQASIGKANELFDTRLESMAKVISAANNEITVTAAETKKDTPSVFFQIWANADLIKHSANAPTDALLTMKPGYNDVNYNGYRWRTLTYHDVVHDRWIVTAERVDIRYSLAESIVIESVLPTVLAIPIISLIIWWVVGLGLRPLRNLSDQLTKKQANDLTPIAVGNLPVEITQLVETTNALFKRLEAAFLREQYFSADAAHELRTPISVLKVHLHNLQTSYAEDNKDLYALNKAINRMGHLIEQILSLYRSSPDQAMAKFIKVNLYQLTKQLIARDYKQFDEKKQDIELTGEDSFVSGEVFGLETLVQNLLSNACKYTPIGGKILVSIVPILSGTRLSVEDSGPGIPANQTKRVFERFYRLHGDQHNSDVIGCGLGLAIVKHIVLYHHATITLGHSHFSSGLKVSVNFPKINQVKENNE